MSRSKLDDHLWGRYRSGVDKPSRPDQAVGKVVP
jgi:hypothetical protein